ncbi:MAG: hypothetical protein R6W73_08335 [Candidatus Saliniplasma sp.]
MIKTSKKRYLVFLIAALLIIGIAFSGCTEDDENGDDEDGDSGELTGKAVYSGTWEGSSDYQDEMEGTWEYTIDFDEGSVTGWFDGDGAGDISGTVSDGEIEASGEAALGTVEWSGEFSDDGDEVSGDWEFTNGEGSGTWTGSFDREIDDGDENGGETGDVEEASSLEYKWEWEEEDGTSGTWTYMVKDIDTENLKMRIDWTEDDEEEYDSFILNKELEKAWYIDNGQWEEVPAEGYDLIVNQYESQLDSHLENYVYDWTGEPIEITDQETGTTLTWYGVEVDPDISDSQFEP